MKEESSLKDFCVLFITHDNWSFAWDHWYYFIKKYWDFNLNCNFYFCNTEKDIKYVEFKQIKINNGNFTDRLIEVLNQIKNNNILLMLEDYWLKNNIDIVKIYENFLRYDINCLRIEGPYFCHISPNNRYTFNDGEKIITKNGITYQKYSKTSKWLIATQPAIWKKEFLLYNLEKNKNPHQFEDERSKLLNNCTFDPKIYFLEEDWYDETIYKGKYNKLGIERIKNKDFFISQSDPKYLKDDMRLHPKL